MVGSTARRALRVCAPALLVSAGVRAQIDVRSDGSDGAFQPPAETKQLVIDLSQALTGTWNRAITAEERKAQNNPWGVGIYDAKRWAVVFKYESVVIPKGVTVRFKNHPSRAPVVWLVSGDVTIDGVVDLSGQTGVAAPGLAEPGPGGFRGGCGRYTSDVGASSGFGPGGGHFGKDGRHSSAGGSYGSRGHTLAPPAAAPYGNAALVPLIGGSGGGGSWSAPYGGGAGGGAILIACAGTIRVNGALVANGGGIAKANDSDARYSYSGGCGSGGAIRLIASILAGTGKIEAVGGSSSGAMPGGVGRIRIERIRVDPANTLQIVPGPSTATVAKPPRLWLIGDDGRAKAVRVRVVSIGGKQVPDDPRASFGPLGPDVELPDTEKTEVVVEAIGAGDGAKVLVRIGPRTAVGRWVEAKLDPTRTNPAASYWKAEVPVPSGYSTVQVKLIRK